MLQLVNRLHATFGDLLIGLFSVPQTIWVSDRDRARKFLRRIRYLCQFRAKIGHDMRAYLAAVVSKGLDQLMVLVTARFGDMQNLMQSIDCSLRRPPDRTFQRIFRPFGFPTATEVINSYGGFGTFVKVWTTYWY